MADTPPSGQPEVTGNVPFFIRPEPLSAEAHGSLGVKQSSAPLAFANTTHMVPVTVSEFGPCALTYPIVFLGEPKTPMAVMGLRPGQNLFIDDAGALAEDAYVPAFVRRYPFVFAQDKAADRYVVCIDAGSDLVVENADVPFFEDGQATKFTNDSIDFLKTFEQQRLLTEELVKVLTENDLFEEKDVQFQQRNPDGSPGQQVKVADYQAVSMEKLNLLPPDTLVGLRDSGALGACYTHTVSLLNWQRIINRALREQQSNQAAAAANGGTEGFQA